MGYKEGVIRDQIIILPESVDEYINEENVVRVIDAYIESLDLKTLGFTKSEPNETGRPPYAPQDMLKLYVYGYMNRIRSSRRLETETKRNLEVIWLLRKLTPDHKTISRFRHDNAGALKNVFRDFVKLCVRLDLYGRELAAIDGSKFKAVNSSESNFSVTELEQRIKRLNTRIDEYIQQLNESDAADDKLEFEKSGDVKEIIERLSTRKNKYEKHIEELNSSGETQKSLTDPDSRLMKGANSFEVSYNVQTSVDSKNKLIAEFNVTNEGNDMKQLTEMAAATAEILDTSNITAVADTGYNNPSEIVKCIEAGITPQISGSEGTLCIPCPEREAQTIESHENGKAVFIKERNIAICPMGNILFPKHYKNGGRMGVYYNYTACNNCTNRCTQIKYRQFAVRMKKTEFSKEYNVENLYIKQIHIKPDPKITNTRKTLAEHPFGTIKRSMDAGYLLTKGLRNVADEFSLVFLAYNLKRVINIMGAKKLIEAMV